MVAGALGELPDGDSVQRFGFVELEQSLRQVLLCPLLDLRLSVHDWDPFCHGSRKGSIIMEYTAAPKRRTESLQNKDPIKNRCLICGA